MKILTEKACSKCGITWPLETGFYSNKTTKDGKHGWCKMCSDANTREHEIRRRTELMSPQAEATKDLYAARFRVIEAAGLSMDTEGLKICRKIDCILKEHGLFAPIRGTPVSINVKRFKGR